MERELHEHVVAVEREVLGEFLGRLDVDVPSVEIEGRRDHRVLRSTETYTAAVGTVTAKRTQRLKRSGMRWRHAGGQAILTLRSLLQSSRFGHAWALLSETYRRDIMVPDNVVAFPRTRAA